jgi:hypothetical protein
MESVQTEWEKVKHLKSLFKYYGTQKAYQRWRFRFIRAGFLQTHGKKRDALYNRTYYAKWRKSNKERVKRHIETYWKKKLCSHPGGEKNMPKRKRQEEKPIAAILYERWDYDKLQHINELVLDSRTEYTVTAVATEMKISPLSRRSVSYTSREFKEGRVYGTGLQGCSGWIRRLCSFRYYHDLDMVNSAPNLLYQIIEKAGFSCPLLREYAVGRSDVFMRLRKEEPELASVSDKNLKEMFLKTLHGGQHTNHFASIGLLPDHPPIKMLLKWESSLQEVMTKLMKHDDFIHLAKQIDSMSDKKIKLGRLQAGCGNEQRT